MSRPSASSPPTVLASSLLTASAAMSSPHSPDWTGAGAANPKAVGAVAPDRLSPEFAEVAVAQGATPVENPTAAVPYYGYDGDQHALVPIPTAPTVEAHKTEPHKNTYLDFPHSLPGADPADDYGTHLQFQGHESGTPGYVTRVNFDADAADRVTLLATQDVAGANVPNFDGSTWDPFAHRPC